MQQQENAMPQIRSNAWIVYAINLNLLQKKYKYKTDQSYLSNRQS
ncbi:hypothetical protein DK880_00238 [Candidatus Cardinium hertigii]|uniref:Uncharacterized protein n=1 Tax=Candidatus Cardinium hertigii TaxID=247481 RepID=A0A2Z3LHN9_9BACT|nr:hypothetical protein DK880_00238 [Candidatus Cardinium hertigii]